MSAAARYALSPSFLEEKRAYERRGPGLQPRLLALCGKFVRLIAHEGADHHSFPFVPGDERAGSPRPSLFPNLSFRGRSGQRPGGLVHASAHASAPASPLHLSHGQASDARPRGAGPSSTPPRACSRARPRHGVRRDVFAVVGESPARRRWTRPCGSSAGRGPLRPTHSASAVGTHPLSSPCVTERIASSYSTYSAAFSLAAPAKSALLLLPRFLSIRST